MAIFYFINWKVATEIIEVGKLFKGGNYSGRYGIQKTIQKSVQNSVQTSFQTNVQQNIQRIIQKKQKSTSLTLCNVRNAAFPVNCL